MPHYTDEQLVGLCEDARRDDWHTIFVGSDIRCLIADAIEVRAALQRLRDHVGPLEYLMGGLGAPPSSALAEDAWRVWREVIGGEPRTVTLLDMARRERDEAHAICRTLLACARSGDPIPQDLPGWLVDRNPVLDWPIDAMCERHGGLWTRARNCLENLGCRTVADVCKHTEAQLLMQRDFGRLSLGVVRDWLAKHGLALCEVPCSCPVEE